MRAAKRRLFRAIGWRLPVFSVAYFGLVAAASLLMPTEFGRGFLFGLGSAGLLALPVVFLAENGMFQRASGAEAERLVSGTLRRLKRIGWHVYDDVAFEGMNVDHVLVAPDRVFAVETKSISFDMPSDARIDAAVEQAWRSVRKLRLLLVTANRLDVEVLPLVCLRGVRLRLPDGATHDFSGDVPIATGAADDKLIEYLTRLGGTGPANPDVVRALNEFVRNRDAG